MHLKSQTNFNEYFLTRKKIFALDEKGILIKRIWVPVTKKRVENERVKGFYYMYYDNGMLLVIISIRAHFTTPYYIGINSFGETLEWYDDKLYKCNSFGSVIGVVMGAYDGYKYAVLPQERSNW